MFENVGKDPDEEAGKRRAASFALTAFALGGFIVLSVGIAAYTAIELVPDLLDDSEMIEIVMEDFEEAAPPPPPPPPPAGAEEEEEEEEEEDDTEVDPDEMDEEIEELDKEPEDKIKSAATGGQVGGVEGGEEGGVVGGVIGGVIGGELGGVLGGVVAMHHSEIEVKKQIQPRYPKAAQEANLGDQRCLAKVFIGADGVPFKVVVENCPQVFHAETKSAIMKWRWYPPKVGRQKVKAQITIGVTYRAR